MNVWCFVTNIREAIIKYAYIFHYMHYGELHMIWTQSFNESKIIITYKYLSGLELTNNIDLHGLVFNQFSLTNVHNGDKKHTI